jgi:oxysterol-binding protein-related protein 8
MLASTGSTSGGGPLIDFHKDMKKDLAASQLKRAETEDSSDEFHDARD